MHRRFVAFALLLGIGGVASNSHGPLGQPIAPDGGTGHAYRLVVADAKTPAIKVVDIGGRRVLSTFALASPARLHAGASGRYVYAVQEQANEVAIIDTGIALESHGDHADIRVSNPKLLSGRLRGPRPSHLTRDNHRVAVFFDGDGTAQVLDEQDLANGRVVRIERVQTGAKHHGVALPIARRLAVTVPADDDGLPNTIEVRGQNPSEPQRIACPRLHGEGTTGRFAAFGCSDGVVVYELVRNGLTGRRIPYPSSVPSGRMIRNIAGAAGFTFFAGDFGADGMVVFDPSAADGDFRFITLPARRMHFNLHPESGDRLFVIVEDGTLLSINPLTGTIEAQTHVTDRYAMDHATVRPRIGSIGRYVVVSNPRGGDLVVLDATTLAERHRIKVGGTPADIVAVGGDGVTH
jgi:hypothetical protein